MKQNPTNSIKAGDRVELRAKNHIKITSDNLMLVGFSSVYRMKLAVCRPICRLSMSNDGKRA